MELPPDYLRGIELFNQGRYFECHEACETTWLQSEGAEREFLHAMIQAAAALLHRERGNQKGAANVYSRSRRKLESLQRTVMRTDTQIFLREIEGAFSGADFSRPQIKLND